MRSSGRPADMAAFTDHLASHYVPNTVIVDATASEVRRLPGPRNQNHNHYRSLPGLLYSSKGSAQKSCGVLLEAWREAAGLLAQC